MGAGAQERIHHRRDGGDNMLAVIEQQQGRARAERVSQRVEERPPGFLTDIENRRDRLRDKRGVGQRGEFHQPDAVRVCCGVGSLRGGDDEREARLSTPAGTGERQEAIGGE